MEQMYQAAAKQLGIAPIASNFRFAGNDSDGGKFAMGGGAGGGYFYQPETPISADLIAASEKKSIAAALRGSATTQDQRDSIEKAFPAFASGGDFMGGLRIVGERGPELEATGPSRIFNAEQTASMLKSGGASGDELLAEMRMLRLAFEQAVINTNKTNNILTKVTSNGDALATRVVT